MNIGTNLQYGRIVAERMGRVYCQSVLRYQGVLVDAAGTLIKPSENVDDVYFRYAAKHGIEVSKSSIRPNFSRSFASSFTSENGKSLKYIGDGRSFWRKVVADSLQTQNLNEQLFEEIYNYYLTAAAWKLQEDSADVLLNLRRLGCKLAVVSNFDTRLRPILHELGVEDIFHQILVSAEVGIEKPNPSIFTLACSSLGLDPTQCVHLGDDRRNDISAARHAGVHALLWKQDIVHFKELSDVVLGSTQ